MIVKTFEVRDRKTFIPILAVKLAPGCEADRYLLARAGFGVTAPEQASYVLVWRMAGGEGSAHSDPFQWPRDSRTMLAAHTWLTRNFDAHPSGAVIDVEYLFQERSEPKESERVTDGSGH